MRLKFLLPLLLIFFSTTLIYFQSLGYYFFQDDWFILNQLNKNSLVYYFVPRADDYYRPLGLQTYFYFSSKLFGFNPLGYHVIPFLVHLVNVSLLFFIILKLFKSRLSAALGSFIYSTSAFHFLALSWPATSWNIFGAFFILGAFNYYLEYLSNNKLLYQIMVYVLFLLALLSTEFAIIIPFFFVVFAYFFLGKQLPEIFKKSGRLTIIMLITIFVYFLIRFVISPIPMVGVYQPKFDFGVFKTLFWYFLWALNVPEELKYHIVLSKLQLTPLIIKDGTAFLLPTIAASFLTIVSFFAFIYKSKVKRSIILGALLIFILFISPVVFLPNHTYPYYLTLPSLGLVLLVSKAVLSFKKSTERVILITIFACAWFFSSFLSVSLNRQIHWVTIGQSISREAIKKVRKGVPLSIANNSEITLENNDTMLKAALSDQDALQVLFNDRSIKTLYYLNPDSMPKSSDYLVKY